MIFLRACGHPSDNVLVPIYMICYPVKWRVYSFINLHMFSIKALNLRKRRAGPMAAILATLLHAYNCAKVNVLKELIALRLEGTESPALHLV